MKKLFCFLRCSLLLASSLYFCSSTILLAQFTPIPSPSGYENFDRGYYWTATTFINDLDPPIRSSSPIVVGTDLYMQYYGNDRNFDLAKYDGTTLTIIPSPSGYENSDRGYFGSPIRPIVVGTDLYMHYRGNDGNFDLAKYDGTTLTIIPSPAGYENSDRGYYWDIWSTSSSSIVVGTDLYLRYLGNDGNYDLAKYDGTTLTIIPSPAGYQNSDAGYFGSPIVVGTDLYLQYTGNNGNYDLAKYDGTTLTIIPSPSPAGYPNSGYGYIGSPIVVGTDLYLRYYAGRNYDLAKYDGTTLTIIPSPAGYENYSAGYFGSPIVVGTDLYMQYYGNDRNYDLAKYDGTTLTIIPSPTGYGYLGSPIGPVLVGTDLYLRYQGNDGNYNLAKYDGTTLTIIPPPTGYENYYAGYWGNLIVVGTDLYMRYVGNDQIGALAKYDGTTLTIISSPAGYNYVGNPIGPIVVGTDLYLRYYGNDFNCVLTKYDGTTLTFIPSPAGYENARVGYWEMPILVGTDLCMKYQGNDGNFDLMQYTSSISLPEINIQGNGADIIDGSTTPIVGNNTDFGSTNNRRVTYTIQNTGRAALTITSIVSSGTNRADFVVSAIPTSVAAGGTATFNVTFTPLGVGTEIETRTATITINSNDANEGTYDFVVRGTTSSNGVVTGEEHIEKDIFKIYPNPSTGIFKVQFPTVLIEDINISIFDATGKVIQTQIFEKGNQEFSIDLQKFSKGMYLICFNQNGSSYSKSVMLE